MVDNSTMPCGAHVLVTASLRAMEHPRCVGWGEIGLDYKVSRAPRMIQQSILERQLRHAVRLGKPITIHTREAEEDTERILKGIVPKDHPVCFFFFVSGRTARTDTVPSDACSLLHR